jgi:hypothetical protein
VSSVLKCCDKKNFKTCLASKGGKRQTTEVAESQSTDFSWSCLLLNAGQNYLVGKYDFDFVIQQGLGLGVFFVKCNFSKEL